MSIERSKSQAIRFDSTRLQTLRARLQGNVLVPGDEGYDTARQTWDAPTFDQHPAIIVLPAISADVQTAVNFAREYDLPIAVQGGGHGHPYPADGALLVNFANMTRLEINPETATARVEPGVKAGDVIAAAHLYGLAPLNGFASTVGIVGYLLGGGFGWLTRQYGPGAGSIRSAELVTADGQLLQVNENSYPDLLWGLRGAGGNFGIVTSLEFALYPVKEIFAGQVVYPIAQGKEVFNVYVQWVKALPDELTSAIRIMHFPPSPDHPPVLHGKSGIVVMACYNGGAKEGEALLQPMRTLGTPLLDTFATIPYSQVGTIAEDPHEAPPINYYIGVGALRDVSPHDIDTMLRIAGNPASGIPMVELRHFEGALARQPEDAMPFGLRQAKFYLNALAVAPALDVLAERKRSIATMIQALQPSLTGEVLINALRTGNASLDLTRAAYSPANYRRLVALKDRYDPKNVFRFNHNIPPSS
ncbi:MAG: FAD-binding oxidoreductase [Chloroflexi bacterium]|nr:FAD-binding oxidoreductase [Chloroflexota bacterium]